MSLTLPIGIGFQPNFLFRKTESDRMFLLDQATGITKWAPFEGKNENAATPDISIIDFKAWTANNSREERLKVATELVNACHPTLLTEAFAWSKKFFDLDEEKKAQIARNPEGLSFGGWVKVGGEALPPVQEEKLKGVIGYNVNYGMESENNTHDPNIWVSETALPGFHAFMFFFPECWKVAQLVLRALSPRPELPDENFLLKFHDEADSDLAIRHYPPANESKIRIAETGQWIDAPPIGGALVMNIGDVLSRWGNDYLTSTVHRVHLLISDLSYQREGKDRMTRSRYSIPFFVVPKDDAVMECLEFPAIQGEKAKCEPITWGEYVRTKTLEIYPDSR
ncbi:Clavaminate synthase-like protein [Stipitochalara longipes BDJ]|nr:Clavaminate synthase-like protein [Stipitochalara longipes BDJ]